MGYDVCDALGFALQIRHWAGQTQDEPTPITQMQLHKLLYYVQGWSLAQYGRPAFGDRIEAWQHGPVVPEVYLAYKSHGSAPLEPARDPPASLGDRDRALVSWVMGLYGRYSAPYLRELTHREPPWQEARAGLAVAEPGSAEITHESMRRFFLEQESRLLGRMGLTRDTLRALRERARSGPQVWFDEAVGRPSRA